MFDTKPYEAKMQSALEHFDAELKKIRTGRAHPNMLDGISVEAYGAKMPLNQVANVSVPEPQQLLVSPFDVANVPSVVEAIRADQGLGFNPSDDGRVVRVPVPPLTQERREQIAKQLGEKVEDCRIAIRNIRHDSQKAIRKLKDDKEINENEQQRYERDIDKLVADFQTKLEETSKAKEKEILTI